MEIKLLSHDDEGELLLNGRLDSSTTPEAEEIFKAASERFYTVILDMKNMEYISSAGLRALKNLHISMKKKDGAMVLKNVNPMVMEVLEMTGFAGLFSIK